MRRLLQDGVCGLCSVVERTLSMMSPCQAALQVSGAPSPLQRHQQPPNREAHPLPPSASCWSRRPCGDSTDSGQRQRTDAEYGGSGTAAANTGWARDAVRQGLTL